MYQLDLFQQCGVDQALYLLSLLSYPNGPPEPLRSSMIERQLHSVDVMIYNCRCHRCKPNLLKQLASLEKPLQQTERRQQADCNALTDLCLARRQLALVYILAQDSIHPSLYDPSRWWGQSYHPSRTKVDRIQICIQEALAAVIRDLE